MNQFDPNSVAHALQTQPLLWAYVTEVLRPHEGLTQIIISPEAQVLMAPKIDLRRMFLPCKKK